MNAIRVTSLPHHCVHEVNGHSRDVDYKSMSHIVCWYIFDYVTPQQHGPDYATNDSLFKCEDGQLKAIFQRLKLQLRGRIWTRVKGLPPRLRYPDRDKFPTILFELFCKWLYAKVLAYLG